VPLLTHTYACPHPRICTHTHTHTHTQKYVVLIAFHSNSGFLNMPLLCYMFIASLVVPLFKYVVLCSNLTTWEQGRKDADQFHNHSVPNHLNKEINYVGPLLLDQLTTIYSRNSVFIECEYWKILTLGPIPSLVFQMVYLFGVFYQNFI
jgi:hypothetical protein